MHHVDYMGKMLFLVWWDIAFDTDIYVMILLLVPWCIVVCNWSLVYAFLKCVTTNTYAGCLHGFNVCRWSSKLRRNCS